MRASHQTSARSTARSSRKSARAMARLSLLLLGLGLSGCQELGIGPGDVGAALGGGFGAYGGGYLGSQVGTGAVQTVSTIAGASVGALFGSAIGRKLAQGDLNLMGQATQATLESSPSGSATAWRNPDSGNAGSIVASPAFERDSRPCRAFQQTLAIDGGVEQAAGTACRRPDGTWDVQPN
jgi:surface antigen